MDFFRRLCGVSRPAECNDLPRRSDGLPESARPEQPGNLPERESAIFRWMQKDLQIYPQVDAPLTGQFVASGEERVDRPLVSRIRAAYRLAVESFKGAGASPWTEYTERLRPIHDALMATDDAEIARIFNDPIPTNLFYGFYSLANDLHVDESSPDGSILGKWSIKQIFGCLIRLGEATGALPLWNPEGNEFMPGAGANGAPLDVEGLLTQIGDQIGTEITFPNPFPGEFGLPSSRGIISYRAPQAIYQAWRVHRLLQGMGGRKFLEIGAGMGRTAYYARRLGISDITLIDLPLANVAQAVFLGRVLGPEAIWLPGDPISQQTGRIRICPADWLQETEDGYDIVLNADSMTEMDQEHAIAYFREINRRAVLFLSINQESYVFRVHDLPSMCGLNIKPARFPYWLRKGYVEEIFYTGARGS